MISATSAVRSVFADSALFVIKGAACIAFNLPTARSTKSVRFKPNHAGVLTLGPIQNKPTEEQIEHLKFLIESKIFDNARYRSFCVPRENAEKVYGEAMYDSYSVPEDVKLLRLVVLEEWNINSSAYPIVVSTKYLGRIEIENLKFYEKKKLVDIQFSVHPDTQEGVAIPLCEDEIADEAALLPRSRVLPPSGVEEVNDYDTDASNAVVTPWDVDFGDAAVNYDKLIMEFGCSRITDAQIQRLEQLTRRPAHRFLRRGVFFAHRDLDSILDSYERGDPFYIYTGRGPSSDSFHMGHLIPFLFTQYLQEVFNAIVVIQITDDEKYLFKEELTLEQINQFASENIKDIMACGFDPDRTFIFRDTDFIGSMYPLILKIQKKVTFNQTKGIFGFSMSDSIGKIAFPAVQAAPSFSECFPYIFSGRKNVRCLIPQGIDQDPYFRMTRDVAPRLKVLKPSLIHSIFFPSLQGFQKKMSGSVYESAIFVTDSAKDIEHKITRYAFSGGQDSIAEHREKGANLAVDIPYTYLTFFLEDDAVLKDIGNKYKSGELLTGEVKAVLIKELQKLVHLHQTRRAAITEDAIKNITNPYRRSLQSN